MAYKPNCNSHKLTVFSCLGRCHVLMDDKDISQDVVSVEVFLNGGFAGVAKLGVLVDEVDLQLLELSQQAPKDGNTSEDLVEVCKQRSDERRKGDQERKGGNTDGDPSPFRFFVRKKK